MPTTLTLDEDVARLVEEAMHSGRRSMKSVVNDALRRALGGSQEIPPYEVTVHHTGLRPGIDPAGFNRLVDELEDDELVEGIRRARP